ncbi:MAG: hypothetical protein IJS33_01705 [Firmicutes bacterium]|nr:hypothetical protein [Bacillota bacterium]
MKKIQIITNNMQIKSEEGTIIVSPLSTPKSLDEFDVNVVDIAYDGIWKNKQNSYKSVNCKSDLKSIREMVEGMKTSTVVYVLPQNVSLNYHYNYVGRGVHQDYKDKVFLKDILNELCVDIIPLAVPINSKVRFLSYENTETIICGKRYKAAFHFIELIKAPVTVSRASEKTTTIKLCDRIYLTTVNIVKQESDVLLFVEEIINGNEKTSAPEWVDSVVFADDEKQKNIINENNAIIGEAKRRIHEADKVLEENARYKSILYTSGEELADIVRDIMCQITGVSLNDYKDNKKQDFLIRGEDYTFIGEIKGVSDNVKRGNVGQIERHYQDYLDKLEEEGINENNVKQLLIINPQRTRPLEARDPVNEEVVSTAKRNNCLIVETKTLLRMYEKYRQGELSIEESVDLLLNNKGLLHFE